MKTPKFKIGDKIILKEIYRGKAYTFMKEDGTLYKGTHPITVSSYEYDNFRGQIYGFKEEAMHPEYAAWADVENNFELYRPTLKSIMEVTK